MSWGSLIPLIRSKGIISLPSPNKISEVSCLRDRQHLGVWVVWLGVRRLVARDRWSGDQPDACGYPSLSVVLEFVYVQLRVPALNL